MGDLDERIHTLFGLEPGMRALVNAPMYHSAPNSYALGVAQEGGTLFIEGRFDAEGTLRLIHDEQLPLQVMVGRNSSPLTDGNAVPYLSMA